MDVWVWHKSLTCRHIWLYTSLAVWFITSSYQVTLLPQFHQREGSHSMDTLSALDSLCVLSLFHTASFIGKPAGLAAPQLPCKSGGVSMQWPADEVMVKNDLSLMRNVVILQRIHYKWQASSPLRFIFSVQTPYHCWRLGVSTWSTCLITWATREPQLKHNNTELLF